MTKIVNDFPFTGQLKGNVVKSNDLYKELMDNQLWYAIRQAAKVNVTLQDALEKCIIIYRLSEKHELPKSEK